MEANLFAQPSKLYSAVPLYFVTNQYNLREILTGRYIGSVLSYDNKYYSDLLDLCPGRIPLFTPPLGHDILEFVNRHDPETSFSVAVEVNPRLIDPAGHPSFNRYGHSHNSSSEGYCYAWTGVIPPSAITGVHFFSESAKNEFGLRDYSEMPQSDYLYRVSPDLSAPNDSLPYLVDWFASLTPVGSPSATDFVHADRASGASVICASRTKEVRDRKYIEQLATGPKTKYNLPPSNRTPYWFHQGFYPRSYVRTSNTQDTNRTLFSVVVNVLHKSNWSLSRRTLSILEAIEQELTVWNVPSEESARFNEIFNRAKGYLRNEKVFEPFKPITGYEVAKALLLFLLRPDPHHLLAWPQEETGADSTVILTAAAFSGILMGRKSLSVEFRPDLLDKQAAEFIVDSLNSLALLNAQVAPSIETTTSLPSELVLVDSPSNSSLQPDFEVEAEVISFTESTFSQDVIADDSTDIGSILENTEEVIISHEVSSGDTTPAVPLSKAFVNLKQQLLEADFNENHIMKSLALRLCNEANWHQCVKSILVCPGDDDVTMKQMKLKTRKVIAFEISGFAEIEYKLDEKMFRELLDGLKHTDKRLVKIEKELAKK